ncbi:MAG: TIGR01841 family phasin [Salinisphaera sp.]|nr:TIGR01841 family phasin [Salinisphaera sp.]
MATQASKVTQLRKDVEKLRKSYTNAMVSANKAAYDGIDKLAEHELAAIKKHYEEALKNVRSLRKGGDPRDVASAQLRLLQETIDRILKNARQSLTILEKTRKKIAADVRRDLQTARKAPASKAATSSSAAKKKPAARKTAAKPAARKTSSARAASTKTTAKRSPAKKTAAKRKSPAAPSPDSSC